MSSENSLAQGVKSLSYLLKIALSSWALQLFLGRPSTSVIGSLYRGVEGGERILV